MFRMWQVTKVEPTIGRICFRCGAAGARATVWPLQKEYDRLECCKGCERKMRYELEAYNAK